MRKVLKYLLVLQEVSNKDREPKLGRGFFTARRLNPYNPLSYVTIVIVFVVGILMFGFVGIWKETDLQNPFKWN
jgi:hypothetical protein